MSLVEYIVAVFAVLIVVEYLVKKRKKDLTSNLNGPLTLPLIGSLHKIYSLTPENYLQKSTESHEQYGKMFRTWAFNRLVISLADPKVAEVFLTSQTHITKHYLYNMLKPWLGTGLLMSDGHKWHSRRKTITPTFHFKILEQFVEVFDQQSEILVKQMEKHCGTGKEFDVYPFICLAALDIIADFLQKSSESHEQYGKMFRIWAFNRLVISLADPKVAEVFLTSQTHITKHHLYNLLKPWLGTGLLMSDGHKWHSRRKTITPTFHFKILEQFVEVFDQQSEILVKQMEKHCGTGKEFDVYPFICLAALDIIAETAMGTKINAQTDSTNAYTKAVTDITEIVCFRFLKIHLANDKIFAILCPNVKRRQTECIHTMHTFTKKVIEERRATLRDTLIQKTNEQQTSIDDIGSKKRMALLDVLLHSTIEGKPLTDEDIREEVDTFMFEGHDTTTSAISFALILIARHPEVQQKLFQEICEVLGRDQTESISYRVLQDFKYTECVIKETLRMYPSVPVIGRQLMHDLVYDGGVLPAGGEVLIGIWQMCNDPDVFPEPEVFRPERHLLEASERTSPFSFIPFSAGPRNCIGQKFAMLEMKSVITKILRSFELLPLGENVKPSMNIVLRSQNGFQVGLQRRIH